MPRHPEARHSDCHTSSEPPGHGRASRSRLPILISLHKAQEGRTLDSLQYILRKIVSRKIAGRVRLSIDVGNYRERRHQELREKAVAYAELVKESGKTQVITSLNPYERRVVHVALQDDTDIRSRSVGDGLFKKVLIYKPGKGQKNSGRKKSRGRYRKKNNQSRNTDT